MELAAILTIGLAVSASIVAVLIAFIDIIM